MQPISSTPTVTNLSGLQSLEAGVKKIALNDDHSSIVMPESDDTEEDDYVMVHMKNLSNAQPMTPPDKSLKIVGEGRLKAAPATSQSQTRKPVLNTLPTDRIFSYLEPEDLINLFFCARNFLLDKMPEKDGVIPYYVLAKHKWNRQNLKGIWKHFFDTRRLLVTNLDFDCWGYNLSKVVPQNDETLRSVIESFSNLQTLIYRTQHFSNFCKFTEVGMRDLQRLPHLTQLDLTGTKITDKGLEEISKTAIKHLTLAFCVEITDNGMLHLRALRHLEHLDLAGTKVKGNALQHLTHLPLTHLDLAWCHKLRKEALSYLGHFPLQYLNVRYCRSFSNANMVTLAKLPLRHLSMSGTKVDDEGLQHIAQKPLTHLDIEDCNITDTGMRYLQNMPLSHLDASSTKITCEGLKYLKTNDLTYLRLKECRGIKDCCMPYLASLQLKTLWLGSTGISDTGLQHLAGKSYDELNLHECRITDASVPLLETLSVRVLNLYFIRDLSRHNKDELYKKLLAKKGTKVYC